MKLRKEVVLWHFYILYYIFSCLLALFLLFILHKLYCQISTAKIMIFFFPLLSFLQQNNFYVARRRLELKWKGSLVSSRAIFLYFALLIMTGNEIVSSEFFYFFSLKMFSNEMQGRMQMIKV